MKTPFLVIMVLGLLQAGHGQQRWDTYVTSLQMPCYPAMARLARAQGTVKIKVTRAADGGITSAEPLEGHALLKKAAIDNIRTWKFTSPNYHDPLEPAIVVFEYKLEDGAESSGCATRVTFQSWDRVTVVSNFNPPLY